MVSQMLKLLLALMGSHWLWLGQSRLALSVFTALGFGMPANA